MDYKKQIYFGFDLDETLIHSKETFKSITDADPAADFYIYDHQFKNRVEYEVFVRPNIDLVLNKVNSEYNMFFYTRAEKNYAENIVSNLGYSELPLFTREDTDLEQDFGPYSSGSKFYVKRLDKIASKLGTSIENIIFIDDVKNNQEIRPLDNVIRIKEFTDEDFLDNEFTKLYKFLNTLQNNDKDLISKLKKFNFDDKNHLSFRRTMWVK